MFDFFKKKEKESVNSDDVKDELSNEEKERLLQDIEEIKISIRELEPEDPANKGSLALLHEKLGLDYAQLGHDDQAINALEKSLDFEISINDGYKTLMNLYNKKRADAARNKNDEEIEKYMNKMDEMRQIAKKGTISGKN